MGIVDRIKGLVSGLGNVATILVILGIVLLVFALGPILILWSINHLSTAFGLGLAQVEIFDPLNILATAILIGILSTIFGRTAKE